MRVFITGASGHIGQAVVPELLAHGHQVVGLARSDASAAAIAALGAEVRRGDLDDHAGLAEAIADADGVIHLAFKHDLMAAGRWAEAGAADLAAIAAIGDALAGTDKPFVSTGGALLLGAMRLNRPATEADVPEQGPRVEAENLVIGLAERGVRSSVIRLASMVHSDLDRHGFTSTLIGMARQHGFAAYVGAGENLWSGLNTYDAAVLYRLALENGPAGQRYHGVESPGIPFRAVAETIAEGLGLEARSVAPEQAEAHLGFLAAFSQIGAEISNARTRELLGWEPTHPDWYADVRTGHYLAEATAA